MYKPKPKPGEENSTSSNRLKLPPESECPSMSKVKFMLDEATNRRGCLVELPWSAGDESFVVTCEWDEAVESPVWTLYQDEGGTGNASKVVWTQSFPPGDLEFMYDILVMSAPKAVGKSTEIPDLLKPTDDPDLLSPEEAMGPDDTPAAEPETESGSYPQTAPLPQPGVGPGMNSGMLSQPPGASGSQDDGLFGAGGQTTSTTSAPAQPPAQPPPQSNTPYPPPQSYPQGQPAYGQPPYGQPPYGQPPPGQPPYGQPPAQAPYGQPPPGQGPYGQPPPGHPAYGQPPPGQPPYGQPPGQQQDSMPIIPVDYNLLDKRPNVLLGSLLVDADLISEPDLEAALKIQELVREEKMSPDKAAQVLKKLHGKGADIEQHLTPEDKIRERKAKKEPEKKSAKPKAAAATSSPSGGKKRNLKPAFDLLQKAGILTENDIQDALAVRKKHGGDLVGILEAANKLNRKTVDAAFICLPLIREGLMKTEQCIIALNYCSRMRVGFDEALDEMGWQNPRHLRSDLPL